MESLGKKNYASFKFKSKSSRTVKIYDLSLKTSSDVVIKELGEDFYIAPFNIVEREFYIGNLNIDAIKTASRRCAYEEKKRLQNMLIQLSGNLIQQWLITTAG